MQIRKKKRRPPTKVAITGLLGDLQNGFLCLQYIIIYYLGILLSQRNEKLSGLLNEWL